MEKEINVIFSKQLEKEYSELNRLVSEELKEGDKTSFHQTLFRAINKLFVLFWKFAITKDIISYLDIKRGDIYG